MEEKDFKVKLSDPIQLQFIPEDGRDRLTARVIGYSPNKSIIISAPSVNGKHPLLKENQTFVVRMLQGNDVYGFESSVLKYYSIPYPHVHLRHPKDLECITVRGSRRVGTEIVVSVTTAADPNKTLSISMLNTSATGALLQTRKQLGNLNDELNISIELEIAAIKKYVRIRAIIRNISTPDDRSDPDDLLNKYGVQFLELNDEQKLVINAYVYEQIVIHMEQP
jgi:c-di-GMP-binding flagellar brake protein YcgR